MFVVRHAYQLTENPLLVDVNYNKYTCKHTSSPRQSSVPAMNVGVLSSLRWTSAVPIICSGSDLKGHDSYSSDRATCGGSNMFFFFSTYVSRRFQKFNRRAMVCCSYATLLG